MSLSATIRHSVVFSLKHTPGSDEELSFIRALKQLVMIPTVQNFELMRETSDKNPYTFGLSMEFADQAAYDAYCAHPDHVTLVKERWQVEVEAFMEIDYALPGYASA